MDPNLNGPGFELVLLFTIKSKKKATTKQMSNSQGKQEEQGKEENEEEERDWVDFCALALLSPLWFPVSEMHAVNSLIHWFTLIPCTLLVANWDGNDCKNILDDQSIIYWEFTVDGKLITLYSNKRFYEMWDEEITQPVKKEEYKRNGQLKEYMMQYQEELMRRDEKEKQRQQEAEERDWVDFCALALVAPLMIPATILDVVTIDVYALTLFPCTVMTGFWGKTNMNSLLDEQESLFLTQTIRARQLGLYGIHV